MAHNQNAGSANAQFLGVVVYASVDLARACDVCDVRHGPSGEAWIFAGDFLSGDAKTFLICTACGDLQRADQMLRKEHFPARLSAKPDPAAKAWQLLRRLVCAAHRHLTDDGEEAVRRAMELLVQRGQAQGRSVCRRCGGLRFVTDEHGRDIACGCVADRSGDRTEAGACPVCGEDLIDRLVWLDDERVECLACGKEYRP